MIRSYPVARGLIAVESPTDWVRAAVTLRSGLGSEANALITAAAQGDPEIRKHESDWAERMTHRLGIDMQISGIRNIDYEEQYVVVALHEGFADALALMALGLPLRFAARSEIRDLPVLGDYLRSANHLITDPERPISAMRTLLSESEDVLAAGESLAVFAQGTILGIETSFRPGAFSLARRLGQSILPVVVAGGHRVWEHPFSPILRFGCPMFVEVLPPVSVTNPLSDMATVQRHMKRRALEQQVAPVRHFDPARDGVWHGYSFEIDPAFPDVAAQVRALSESTSHAKHV